MSIRLRWQMCARSIVDHSADEFQPDLIILCAHGNSGMHNLLFGSIAQQVAAASGTPVLLIKPEGEVEYLPPGAYLRATG